MYNVAQKAVFDESTEGYKYTIYYPNQGSDLNGFSDLRIHVQGKDYYYHPANAYLTIKGQLVQKANGEPYAGTEDITMINNGILYLFSKLTFRIGGRDVEDVDAPGQTTSMILHTLHTSDIAKSQGLSMCWYPDSDTTCTTTNVGYAARKAFLFTSPTTKGKFTFLIPLKYVFGICSDYDRVIYGYDLGLSMVRQDDYHALHKKANAAASNVDVPLGKVNLHTVTLHMPIVSPTIATKMKLSELIKTKIPVSINYRERRGQSIDIPVGNTTFDWQFSTISLPKRPKFLFVGFQDQKETNQTENYGLFKNANISRICVSVNNTQIRLHKEHPANFAEMDFSEFYRSFMGVRQNLFGIDDRINQSHISPSLYRDVYTIYALDLSKHREEITEQTVSTTLHVHFRAATTKPMRCFVTILCDKEVILQGDGKTSVLVV